MKRCWGHVLGFALGSALLFAPGLLPAGAGPMDAHAALVWCTFWVVPLGVWAGAARRPWLCALGAALGLALVLAALAGFGARDVPSLSHGGAVLLGGLGLGVGLGSLLGRRAATAGSALVLVAVLGLSGLAVGGGLFPSPPAAERPALGAALLDLSPLTWVLESAGVDWERHPAVYGPAGTDWFSGQRRAFQGALLGPLALLVGALAAVGGTAHAARTKRGGGALPLAR